MIPDITVHDQPKHQSKLDWVGMRGVEVPVQINGQMVPARVDVLVNLHNPVSKGIHMSRLYLAAKSHLESSELTGDLLAKITNECIVSHEGLSDKAQISVHFEYMRSVDSLLSDNSGWRYYPATLGVSQDAEGITFETGTLIF